MHRGVFSSLSCVFALAVTLSTAAQAEPEISARPAQARKASDELFPGAGRFAVTGSTGIPYVAIGEIAYGFTDRFTFGIIGGFTPSTPGWGVRARGVLVEQGANRLVVNAPVLYYPASEGLGNEPWLLTIPTLLAERRFNRGTNLHAGVGLAAAACTGAIESVFTGYHLHNGELMEGGSHETMAEGGEGFMGGIWPTLTAGGAWAVGEDFHLFADVALVTHDLAFARNWIAGPPVILTMGVTRTF